jgi:hypothetical protein
MLYGQINKEAASAWEIHEGDTQRRNSPCFRTKADKDLIYRIFVERTHTVRGDSAHFAGQ